jgi:hypothetical protein
MSEQLPSVFIGSSTEGLDVAREVELQLQRDAVTTIWKDGVFSLGDATLESLMKVLDQFDFAVMVLSPDDLVESRSESYASPRDNVLFELGLFMGKIGRSRVFIVREMDVNLKLPSDLAGIAVSPYRKRENLSAALSPTCTPIIKAIRSLGFSEQRTHQQIRQLQSKTTQALGDIKSRQEEQQEELSRQQAQIRSLQVALQGIVTQYELDKLVGLDANDPFLCYFSEDLYEELKRLRAMGLVRNHEGTGLGSIRRQYRDRNEQFDLRRFFYITEQGREYLQLRHQLTADDRES